MVVVCTAPLCRMMHSYLELVSLSPNATVKTILGITSSTAASICDLSVLSSSILCSSGENLQPWRHLYAVPHGTHECRHTE